MFSFLYAWLLTAVDNTDDLLHLDPASLTSYSTNVNFFLSGDSAYENRRMYDVMHCLPQDKTPDLLLYPDNYCGP